MTDKLIDIATSNHRDANSALAEIAEKLPKSEIAFVLLLFSENFNPQELETAIKSHLGHHSVFGCSTSGQISPKGYERQTYIAIGFRRAYFRVASLVLNDLKSLSIGEASKMISQTSERFTRTPSWNSLVLMFIDGLSKQEDILTATVSASLPDTPVYGGSAADGGDFSSTFVYADGVLHRDAALLLFLQTSCPTASVNFDHFTPTLEKMVVTKALPDERVVMEINGAPAAQEYARIVGVDRHALGTNIFAHSPLLVSNGGNYFVRGIQKANDDDSLEFFCSIDEGLILTLGQGHEIVRTMERELGKVLFDDARPSFIFAFDCFLRRLEIEDTNRIERASRCLAGHNVVGFNTFGEQHHGVHVNQTFVGVAFYPPDPIALS